MSPFPGKENLVLCCAKTIEMNDRANAAEPRSPYIFRSGTSEEQSRCAEIWMDSLALRDSTDTDPQVMKRALAKLAAPAGILTVAESGSRTHGFAMAVDRTLPSGIPTVHLTLLAVDPASQSRGLGRALLAHFTHSLGLQGFVQATLSVLEENIAARKIYEDAGWQATSKGVFEDSARPCIRYRLRIL